MQDILQCAMWEKRSLMLPVKHEAGIMQENVMVRHLS